MLYVAGDADFNDSGSVSVVGTRLASSYGRETCRKIISHLKESGCDPSIVSGLAYGIDVCAHRAALDSGLRTIGVLPCGIDRIYPSRHRNIAAEMTVRGAVVTEFPRGTGVTRYGFIKRNRIIAGMSEAVIVVETRIKGGSMNTVEYALSYGRDVFAVPGRISDVNSYGCNYLISKNMAAIYCSRETVPAALGWKKEYISEASLQNDIFSFDESKKEKILLTLTSASSSDMDSIMLATGLGFEEASALMLELEMEGRIRENGDNEYYLADD
jgi:DNA processing protein